MISENDKKTIDAIEKYHLGIGRVADEKLTEAVCCYFVEQNPNVLQNIPSHKRTESVILAAVNKNGSSIRFIDFEEQTYKIAFAAVKNNPYSLQWISRQFWTPELLNYATSHVGYTLKFILKSYQTYDLCLAAVNNDGLALEFVSKKIVNEDICEAAVQNDGNALSFVPNSLKTQQLCEKAVMKCGSALQFVPNSFINEDLCVKAVKNDGEALFFVPSPLLSDKIYKNIAHNCAKVLNILPKKYHNKKLYEDFAKSDECALKYMNDDYVDAGICEIAVQNFPSALICIPTNKLTVKLFQIALEQDSCALRFLNNCKKAALCNYAIEVNGENLQYVNKNIVSLEMCLKALKNTPDAAKHIPYPYCIDNSVLEVERELGLCKITAVWYEDNAFFVKEQVPQNYTENNESKNTVVTEFSNFDDFYAFMDGDLQGVNLSNCDFKGVNLPKYNIDGCIIDSNVLISQGLYDGSFFDEHIKNKITVSVNNIDDDKSSKSIISLEARNKSSEYDTPIYYVSDLHLVEKISQKFGDAATTEEVDLFLRLSAAELINSIDGKDRKYNEAILIISGDVSSDFEIAKTFFCWLSEYYYPGNIFFVLGNHELYFESSVRSAYQKYKELSEKLGFHLIQNDLCIFREINLFNDFYALEHEFIYEKELLGISEDDLRQKLFGSSFALFGGLGFSGYAGEHSATSGIYGSAIKSLDADLTETQKFEDVYNKLNNSCSKNRIIVATHTPKEYWSKREYNHNWIYINGHTHNNFYEISDRCTVYADNQIGYTPCPINAKHFYLSGNYDIFDLYKDGIYEISRQQYINFNRGFKIRMTFSEKDGIIRMLKRSGFYCFVYESGNKLYLLNGATLQSAAHNLDYYYENMVPYAQRVTALLAPINDVLMKISESVRSCGGSGKIHGTIVDIDYSNHLYFNVYDGSIVPYYATSTTDKTVYRDFSALPVSEDMCIKLKQFKSKFASLSPTNNINRPMSAKVKSTQMYQISNVVHSLQYISDYGIIRAWNDVFINGGAFLNCDPNPRFLAK